MQMSTLMGGQVDATEDMFSKLESMRAVITEVNTQFKDPVRAWTLSPTFEFDLTLLALGHIAGNRRRHTGKDNVRLRLHIRVPLTVRDGAARTGAYGVRNRHAQYRRESVAVPKVR
jgi:hypothetical protein